MTDCHFHVDEKQEWRDEEKKTYEVLITPAIVACPEAVIIRDLSTSAGEQTANH